MRIGCPWAERASRIQSMADLNRDVCCTLGLRQVNINICICNQPLNDCTGRRGRASRANCHWLDIWRQTGLESLKRLYSGVSLVTSRAVYTCTVCLALEVILYGALLCPRCLRARVTIYIVCCSLSFLCVSIRSECSLEAGELGNSGHSWDETVSECDCSCL